MESTNNLNKIEPRIFIISFDTYQDQDTINLMKEFKKNGVDGVLMRPEAFQKIVTNIHDVNVLVLESTLAGKDSLKKFERNLFSWLRKQGRIIFHHVSAFDNFENYKFPARHRSYYFYKLPLSYEEIVQMCLPQLRFFGKSLNEIMQKKSIIDNEI